MLGRIGRDGGASRGRRPDHCGRFVTSDLPCQRF
jgi:hypothetical protein